jgi:uncharacterized lipoprotein YddW (UPF0748 family)
MLRIILLFLTWSVIHFEIQAQSTVNDKLRGTWITNVASDAMLNEKNVKEAVLNCKRNGLTDIFVVVWNNGLTTYPSKVVQNYIGIKQDPRYKQFDPIAAFVEQGHKNGLKVHAWFEFGFSYAYKDSSQNNWLSKYPHWVGRDQKQNLLKKNGFFWWNSLHPEVQDFMQQLVLEVVQKYKVDGVQGDDRLPAMPSEGGYDSYTTQVYADEYNGVNPPLNSKDPLWIRWRSNKLNDFAKKLYGSVKKMNPACIVSWAPSIYPWSLEQYLQDWPTWLKEGYADLVIPQVYRYQFDSYAASLKAVEKQVPDSLKHKIYPGILTSLGDGYRVDSLFFQKMISLNRTEGYNGEVLFYYETIKEAKNSIYKN